MNEYEKRMLDAPSIESAICPFCGKRATNRHHIIKRSHGGADGPTITVCGMGNASGCHSKLHAQLLHLRYKNDAWEYLATESATKYERALAMDGWRVLRW